jgi:low affinity Fe/Cu permease
MNKKSNKQSVFEKISSAITRATGSSAAFIIAFSVILIWILSGPLFKFSDTWQLVIITSTTIITFLMVFLIQRSQNKDSIALHLKLNELVVAQEHASNRLVSVENISESELKVLQKFYKHLAQLTLNEVSVEESHSLDMANALHANKVKASKVVLKNDLN